MKIKHLKIWIVALTFGVIIYSILDGLQTFILVHEGYRETNYVVAFAMGLFGNFYGILVVKVISLLFVLFTTLLILWSDIEHS